jgi:hypothetical protein
MADRSAHATPFSLDGGHGSGTMVMSLPLPQEPRLPKTNAPHASH